MDTKQRPKMEVADKFPLAAVRKFFDEHGLITYLLVDKFGVRHTLEVKRGNELLAEIYIGGDHIKKAEVVEAVQAIKAKKIYRWTKRYPERLKWRGKRRAIF